MVINTNVEASSTANNLNVSQAQLAKSLSRLSSGSKIIQPSDDAAGLAVASRLKAQIKRLDLAFSNVINAVSFTQTQDGFMKTIDAALRRMGELAMLAQDGTKSGDDIKLYNEEFGQLKAYINATKLQKFNDVDLFGSDTLAVTVDAGGSTFGMPPVDLSVDTYDGALTAGGSSIIAAQAQVDTIDVTTGMVGSGDTFTVTVNGQTTAAIPLANDPIQPDRDSNTATAIAAAINDLDGVKATASGDDVKITSLSPGTAFIGATSVVTTGTSSAIIETGGAGDSVENIAAFTSGIAIDTGSNARTALVEIKEEITQIARNWVLSNRGLTLPTNSWSSPRRTSPRPSAASPTWM